MVDNKWRGKLMDSVDTLLLLEARMSSPVARWAQMAAAAAAVAVVAIADNYLVE